MEVALSELEALLRRTGREESPSRLLDECLVSLKDAAQSLPSRPSKWQLDAWRQKGLRVPGLPRPVFLECIKIGRRWHTSHEAFARFIKATNLF